MPGRIEFLLNGVKVVTADPPGLLVLDWLRDQRRLTGTKEGCKEGDCGACSVLIGVLDGDRVAYRPVTSCLVPLGELHGKHLVTIEGVSPDGGLNPAQAAMVERGGSQCGYCTPGFIVSMTWQVMQGDDLDGEGFRRAISGNLCRCTGYGSSFRACDDLVDELGEGGKLAGIGAAPDRVTALAEAGHLPAWFLDAAKRLKEIPALEATSSPHTPDFLIAGGTDLYVQRGEEIPIAEVEVLGAREDLSAISLEGDVVRLGPAATFQAFAEHPDIQEMLPSLHADMDLIASLPIRNRATFAGNVINASPIGDMTAYLLALGARVTLTDRGTGAARTLPLEELYLGYKTLAKTEEEWVTGFDFDRVCPPTHVSLERVSKRRWLDIPSVNSVARLTVDGSGQVLDARLAIGGVAAIPLFLKGTSAWLVGQPMTSATVAEALRRMDEEIAPISDVRGSAAYKRLLARQLVLAHFVKLYPDRVSLREVLGGAFSPEARL